MAIQLQEDQEFLHSILDAPLPSLEEPIKPK